MRDIDRALELRRKIIDDWRWRRLSWQDITYKYGISKAWFYKLRKRFIVDDYEGLKDKIRDNSNRPNAITWEDKLRIMNYIFEHPTHGPYRIGRELDPPLSGKAVWSHLVKENLNTRRKRRLWAHHQGKPVLTKKEKLCIAARNRHIESNSPGELVSVDTFMVCVKELGKIWQYTACDTYSSYGWAKVYYNKTSDESIDFLKNHILKNVPQGKIKRVLTDQGTEFYFSRAKYMDHLFTECLNSHGIKHSVTKVAHPWTNGYAERLNQTIWQEFYLCRLSRPFAHIVTLNEELGQFMKEYNFNRRHTGYKLKELGLEFPAHAFFDLRENQSIIEINS